MLVQLNNTAHHATIILKMAMPIRVREYDIRSAVRAMLIGAVEEMANIRLNLQCVEVVPAHYIDPGARWIFASVQPCQSDVISCQTVEAAVAIAQIEIVWIRLSPGLIPTALDSVEALRLRHIQRAQYKRIHYTENHGVCANSQCQRENRNHCESGRLAQNTKAEAHILYKSLDEIAAERFA